MSAECTYNYCVHDSETFITMLLKSSPDNKQPKLSPYMIRCHDIKSYLFDTMSRTIDISLGHGIIRDYYVIFITPPNFAMSDISKTEIQTRFKSYMTNNWKFILVVMGNCFGVNKSAEMLKDFQKQINSPYIYVATLDDLNNTFNDIARIINR